MEMNICAPFLASAKMLHSLTWKFKAQEFMKEIIRKWHKTILSQISTAEGLIASKN